MGPNLFQFLLFYGKGFVRKTIINILVFLLKEIELLASKKILHRDIKPENIVYGVINRSESEKQKLYLIDFGLSIFMDKQFESKDNYDNIWKCGTNRYMSIDTHKNLIPLLLITSKAHSIV